MNNLVTGVLLLSETCASKKSVTCFSYTSLIARKIMGTCGDYWRWVLECGIVDGNGRWLDNAGIEYLSMRMEYGEGGEY